MVQPQISGYSKLAYYLHSHKLTLYGLLLNVLNCNIAVNCNLYLSILKTVKDLVKVNISESVLH